jgi:rubrerythrin
MSEKKRTFTATEKAILRYLTIMGEYEGLLSTLYRSFSRLFPGEEEFWKSLALEENTHALMVDTIIDMVYHNETAFEGRSFSWWAIRRSLGDLKRKLTRVQKNGTTLEDAVASALRFENNIIERKIFEMKESDSPEFKKMLTLLIEESRVHYEKIISRYRELPAVKYRKHR